MDAGHIIEGLLSICLGLLYILKHQEANRLRNGTTGHTFADDPEGYWRRMKDVVTEPLSAVLAEMKDVMREQSRTNTDVLKTLARMDGEQRGRHS